MPATPRGRFHRLPFGPSLRFGDARTVPMAPLSFKLRCSNNWNYINSTRTKVILIPAGWKTHTAPELGTRPQELINSRILRDCDLLIGVFWTRLGTPTGKSESGTVEEIEEHIKAGKPAMIYFSSKPAAPESIDAKQYSSLKAFKERCRELGLVEEFDNLIEFKDKVTNHLQLCLLQNSYL